jgi:hypothetical protein
LERGVPHWRQVGLKGEHLMPQWFGMWIDEVTRRPAECLYDDGDFTENNIEKMLCSRYLLLILWNNLSVKSIEI